MFKANYKVKAGDVFTVMLPEPELLEIRSEAIPLDVIFEDEDVVVVNKSRGMVVHPAPGHYTGTLVNALLHHCQNLSGINNVIRPGIVHRLDKDTSGIMLHIYLYRNRFKTKLPNVHILLLSGAI